MFKRLKGALNTNRSTLTNMFWLTLNQFVLNVIPFLILPYLLIYLKPDGVGRIAYLQSFVSYFSLVVEYGFSISGTRKVALKKDESEFLRKLFWNIFYARLLLFVISTFIFAFSVIYIHQLSVDVLLAFLMWGIVLANVFNALWFFLGIGKLTAISIIQVVSKIIFLGLVLFKIKAPSDISLYVVIYVLSNICINHLFWTSKLLLFATNFI